MQKVQHENVIKIIDGGKAILKSILGDEINCYYISMELAYTKSLDYFIDLIENEPLAEDVAVIFFQQLMLGLLAIHETGLCHRDIKANNLFLDTNLTLKIGDFGFSAPLKGKYDIPEKQGKLYSFLGTPGLLAPEVLKMELNPNQGYSGDRVDIFNAGVVLFRMLFQKCPFAEAKVGDLHYEWVIKGQPKRFWESHENQGLEVEKVSVAARELIYSMLLPDPNLRPSVLEVLYDEWVQKTPRCANL